MNTFTKKVLISAGLSLAGSLLFVLGTWLSGAELSWTKLSPALAASIGSWMVNLAREFGKLQEGTKNVSEENKE